MNNKVKVSSEHILQSQCVRWFRLSYPKFKYLLFSVPNGAMLHGNKLQRVKHWRKLQSEGATKGVSDLILLLPKGVYHGLCIEMKTKASHSRQTPEQKEFQSNVCAVGYAYVIPTGFDEFKTIVDSYIKNGIV